MGGPTAPLHPLRIVQGRLGIIDAGETTMRYKAIYPMEAIEGPPRVHRTTPSLARVRAEHRAADAGVLVNAARLAR
ncbi:hypothetical protein [Streptomyces microflavus]